MTDIDETALYRVVVNDEQQFSVWPEGRDAPAGWRDAGVTGPISACLDHIEQVWTDLRPLSLRDQEHSGDDA